MFAAVLGREQVPVFAHMLLIASMVYMARPVRLWVCPLGAKAQGDPPPAARQIVIPSRRCAVRCPALLPHVHRTTVMHVVAVMDWPLPGPVGCGRRRFPVATAAARRRPAASLHGRFPFMLPS